MKESAAIGGHKWIYKDLLTRLADADITTSAQHLGLEMNAAEEVQIPFCGKTYLISKRGVRRTGVKRISYATGSALIYYILKGSRSRPNGQFVRISELAGPLFEHGSYSHSALELPIIRRFKCCVPDLLSKAASFGGYQGGEAGLGGVSLIFNLLPHIPLQLIFYDQDEEFPARATLLFSLNATELIDFEVLAVLVSVFVQSLTGMNCDENP